MAALRGVPFLVPRGWFCLAADLSAIFQLQGWTCVESSLGAQAVGSPGSRRGEAIPCSASEAQALFAEAAQAVTGSHHVLRGYKQEAVCSPLGHL